MTKTRVWSALGGLVMVAVLAAGWFLLVSPKNGEAAELREQTVGQDQANGLLQSRLKQLKEQHKQLPAKRKELRLLGRQIPDEPGLPTLIRQLTADAKSAGVDLKSITPADPSPVLDANGMAAPATGPEQVLQVSVAVNVAGHFFELEKLLQELESMPRLFQVTGFTLEPRDMAPGQRLPVLDMNVTGRVFLLASGPVTLAPPAAATAQPTPGATPGATPATGTATPAPAGTPATGTSTDTTTLPQGASTAPAN